MVTTWLWNYLLPEKLGQDVTERHLQGAQMNNAVTGCLDGVTGGEGGGDSARPASLARITRPSPS